MSGFQDQHKVPIRSPSDGVESDITITVEEKKLVRKLIRVLTKMVSEDDIEVPPSPHSQMLKDHESAGVAKVGEGFLQFKKLCENHSQLTNQIRSALNALGGGSRAAKALQAMNDNFKAASVAIRVRDKSIYLKPERCVKGLNEACITIMEVMDSFRELRVFNTAFFEKLLEVRKQLKITTDNLGLEYGLVGWCEVDEYLDLLWGPLASKFEKFIKELTTVAEKELASIRQTQEFASQRYLNLTTVATFLSSVTATTLQISANSPSSGLVIVTNTFWFISLVFSAASAVYSLLIMTWRQSSVRRPDLSLPPLANTWLRNAPVYSLIAALCTFSFGLCLLSFLVVEQQGGPGSASVPIAFAGFHAIIIFLLSGWFLLEQWRNKHERQWVKVKDKYLLPAVSTGRGVASKIRKTARGMRMFSPSSAMRKLWFALVQTLSQNGDNDIEPGQGADPAPPRGKYEKRFPEEARELADNTELLRRQDEFAISESVTIPGNESKRMESDAVSEKQDAYRPMLQLLQFSPDGRYLALAVSNAVTIYRARGSFDTMGTRKVPGADTVKQIAFADARDWNNDLLLRTTKQIYVWTLARMKEYNEDYDNGDYINEDYDDGTSVKFDDAVVSARWVDQYDSTRGFVCATGVSIKLFDNCCKELHSYDISKMHRFESIVEVASFRKKYIFCLVTLLEGGTELLAFNQETASIERTFERGSESTSIVTTPISDAVLLYNSERVTLLYAREEGLCSPSSIWFSHNYMWGANGSKHPEALTMFGKGDRMIIKYSSDQIASYPGVVSDPSHLFTTPDADAIVKNPVGFAVVPARTAPYMFAFLDKDGSVTIWSVQSNSDLAECDEARDFDVHDRRNGRSGPVTVTRGKYLKLPPPEISSG